MSRIKAVSKLNKFNERKLLCIYSEVLENQN